MGTTRRALVMLALMGTATVGSFAIRPSTKARDRGKTFSLEAIVPKRFADWAELPGQGVQVVNPQTQALLDKLYSQILARAYVDSAGYRVMLSLAYGDDQRGAQQAHKPEVCYPAQGFEVHSNVPSPRGRSGCTTSSSTTCCARWRRSNVFVWPGCGRGNRVFECPCAGRRLSRRGSR